jgi:hypothetical protein
MIKHAVCLQQFSIVLVLLGSLVAADDATHARGKARLGPLPWHLVDIYFETGREEELESIDIDLELTHRVPETATVFIVPVDGLIHESAFYSGLLSNIPDAQKRVSGFVLPDVFDIGPGLTFTKWGDNSLGDIRPSREGYFLRSAHEGPILSARTRYPWKESKYTLKVVKMHKEVINGSSHTWFGAFLFSHESFEYIYIGSLRFKAARPKFASTFGSFIEVFEGLKRRITPADTPKLDLRLMNYRINGERLRKTPITIHYPDGSPDYADVKVRGSELVVMVGRPVPDRRSRVVKAVLD